MLIATCEVFRSHFAFSLIRNGFPHYSVDGNEPVPDSRALEVLMALVRTFLNETDELIWPDQPVSKMRFDDTQSTMTQVINLRLDNLRNYEGTAWNLLIGLII